MKKPVCNATHKNDRRQKPLVRAVALATAALFAPLLHAAPPKPLPLPINTLPVPMPNGGWLVSGGATNKVVGGNNMIIDQTTQKAILDWKSFNVSKDAKVQFNQPSSSASTLNRINDQSASQIQGQISANGNIYLVNNNGILFSGDSKVNVHGLVASTLNIDANTYINSSLSGAINGGKAALEGGTADGAMIVIDAYVDQDQKVHAATIATDEGGQVLIFAPGVLNKGNISTPGGQTILAGARDKVYLAVSDNNSDLRGLLVEVNTGGGVANLGQIVAERGNITLLGLAINQSGVLRATTSVDVNGSIRLLARDKATLVTDATVLKDSLLADDQVDSNNNSRLPSGSTQAVATEGGALYLGAGSVTEVGVVSAAEDKGAADAQLQSTPRIDLMGKTIELASNSTVRAKGGRVNVVATATPNNLYDKSMAKNDSRIIVGSNATIDVSGQKTELEMSSRVVAVELRGDELKDAPLQRDGVLHGKTVYVDIDKGTPLVSDLSPTLAKLKHTVTERLAAGGTINMKSQGDVVLGDQAHLDIAGGAVSYKSGTVETTKLLASNGQIVDIGSADPNRKYDGVFGEYDYSHPKWGKTVYRAKAFSTYREGFTQGKAGGALNIDTQTMYGFDLVDLQAGANTGLFQRAGSTLPKGGTVTLNLGQGGAATINSAQDVVIRNIASSVALSSAGTYLDPGETGGVEALAIAASQLNKSGVGKFILNANGTIHQTADASIVLKPGAEIRLTGNNILMDGRIGAPGGTIGLIARAPDDGGDHTHETFAAMLSHGSWLDTSGSWVNDLLDGVKSGGDVAPSVVNGGSITVQARNNVTVAAGSILRSDAGAQLTSTGSRVTGAGGTISLASLDSGAQLKLDGLLSAYGFSKGGTLNITAPQVDIGARPANADPDSLWLGADFFTRSGFGQYGITATHGDLVVHSDAALRPRQQNLQFSDLWQAARLASGGNIRSITAVASLADYLRAPTSLALTTANSGGGSVRVDTGASIVADPRANIALQSAEDLFVDGSILAKGGAIDLQITSDGPVQANDLTQMLWLGSHAQLDASATRTARFSTLGLLDGDIVDAGSINLQAARGAVVTAKGSSIDVSGASYQQDYVTAGAVKRNTVNASAGSVSLIAANGIAAFGTMKGTAAGTDGLGGSLTVRLDAAGRNIAADNTAEYNPRVISVVDTLPTWDGSVRFGTALPTDFAFKAVVAADAVRKGGFTSLALASNNLKRDNGGISFGGISFDSDITLSLADTLMLSAVNIAVNDHKVELRAPLIQVGQGAATGESTTVANQTVDTPVAGTGELSLYARFMELVGNIGVGGTQRVALNSTNDIRLRAPNDIDGKFVQSTFSTTGDVAIQASEVYGATLTDYTFALLGNDGKFTYTPSGGARTPILSAASKLTISAPHIDIGGTLLAPLGTLTLNATKDVRLRSTALLDVSADSQLIPFGRIQGGDILWSYPILTGKAPLLIEAAPEKSVVIKGPVVSTDKGSTINVSGGGDVYGIEQIPGTGGSLDFLDPANSKGAFAVVPWLNSSVSPYDAVEMAGFRVNGSGPKIGDVIYLDGGSGLPAGTYAILPAHYALLEGAYLITPKSGSLQQGQSTTQVDGTVVVAGRYGRAFSNSYDSQWQSFEIEPGTAARTRSEYNIVTGDKFFAEKPDSAHAGDAGRVTLDVGNQLDLLGSIIGAASQNGRKAQLDIVADQVEVVNTRDANSTAVQLLVSDLNGVGVDSILLGGRRSGNGLETTIAVGASTVDVRSGATLSVPDIILAARDRVSLETGATLSATGASTAVAQKFNIDGDGALLRVSSAAQADVNRTNSTGSTGVVNIADGAKVFADYSILIDSSQDMSLLGSIGLKSRSDVATSLNLTANRISLGDGSEAATSGLSFSNVQLNSFNAQALRLSSRSGIDFYGDVRLDNQRVELNAGALRNMQGGDVQLRAADTIQLDNASDVTDIDSSVSGGRLVLASKKVVLGNGYLFGELIEKPVNHRMSLSGFDQVDLGAAGVTTQLLGEGNFTLATNANVNVIADRVGGSSGSTTSIDTQGTGTINLSRANTGVWDIANTVQDIAAQLGARFNLTGKRISQGTHIDLPSGVLTMKATGAAADDNVELAAGSVTDVSGRKLVFPQGSAVASDGGEVHIASAAGDVVGAAGAKVVLGGSGNFDGATLTTTGTDNTSKVTLAGNSGLLDIVAKGKALWNAGIQAVAGSDAKGGNLQLDVGEIDTGTFGNWLQSIADGGIDQRVSLRSRSGDLVIDRQIRANTVTVSADSGDVTLAANIDARGGDGGHVALWGGNNLNIGAGARIDASATADGGRGGRVELGARDGTLTLGANSALDVAGHAGATGQDAGSNGSVLLRAPRTATNDDVQVANNGVKIGGATRIELEAFKSYDATIGGTVASVINGAYSDTAQFMNNSSTQAALKARFADAAPAGVFHVAPGIDIFSTGDLTLGADVNLSGRRYGAIAGQFDGEAGVLSLRAAGNLSIQANLNDGWVTSATAYSTSSNKVKNAAVDMMMRDFSWDYRLIGGADLSAANPNTVQSLADPQTGKLVVSGGKDIVTGAGWINLLAANAVDVQSSNSVIAILGRSDFTTYANPLTTGPQRELLPDTGSVDPYHLLVLNANGTTNVTSKYPFYPKDGGDLTISAGSDVKFATSNALFNTWMLRVAGADMILGNTVGGSVTPLTRDFATWGVVLDALLPASAAGEGVVVLGGGNVNVRAGASVVNLNAALPVTAKQVGTNGNNALSIIGGGNLTVNAGGDVLSSRLWVDRGNIDVTAGGSFTAAAGGLQPILALADTQVDIRARGDVSIGAAFNSTMMPISSKTKGAGSNQTLKNYFFTYADDASIDAVSLQGDVIFANDTLSLAQSTLKSNFAESNLPDGQYALFTVYPSRLSATAINRNIKVENSMTLFPSTKGQLVLLAGKDITMGDNATADSTFKVNLSDVDPALLPTFAHAATTIFDDQIGADSVLVRLAGETTGTPNPFWHASTPLHVADKDPAIIAALGDIGVDGNLIFELAKPVSAYAGNDVRNITFMIQHSNPSQVSEIVAGRDVTFPIVVNAVAGTVDAKPDEFIRVSGPGRLDVIAGRDVDLGASNGIEASANLHNSALPEQGANVNVLAGINGPTALTDPILYGQFADRYFGAANTLSGSYIDWFSSGAFTQSTGKTSINRTNLVSAFTGRKYADDASALADFKNLPVLTQQAIALEAYQNYVTPTPGYKQATDLASLQLLGGDLGAALEKTTGHRYEASEYASAVAGLSKAQRSEVARTLTDASSYTAQLIDFVSLDRFGGDLTAAVSAVTGKSYGNNAQAATALALLPAAQQQAVARHAIDGASTMVRRELLLDVYTGTVRAGGSQQAVAKQQQIALEASEGYNRSYAAIEAMFPGKKWSGDVKLALSGLRTFGDGDINVLAPGGDVDVGLANKISGLNKEASELGIIVSGFGAINGIASGSFNINQSRIFALGNGDISLWSSFGNVDAGKGAKTALSVQPPKIVFAPDGSSRLVYTTPVAGSGIQGGGPDTLQASDRGPLDVDQDGAPLPLGDTQSSRLRYVRSLSKSDTYLFAPEGTVNAGDAGISVSGNLLVAANQVVGADNIKVGGVSVGVPTTTSISSATLSLGNVASSATEGATSQMNNAIKDTAAALAAGGVAFVTVDIIGIGQ